MKWIHLLLFLLSFVRSGTGSWFPSLEYISGKLGFETCTDDYINQNFVELEGNLRKYLFGQDIVIKELVRALKNHFTQSEPKKALVICLHGWTGSGKNYAVQIAIKSLYKMKLQSRFVHFYNGRLHFPVDKKDHVDRYKVNLQTWIRGNVSDCPRSMFIFDEVDKIPPGTIDGIKPYLDHHPIIDSVDYRKSIFVFISNVGGGVINQLYNQLWRSGTLRKDMRYIEFEPYLRQALYSTEGGLESSSILDSHLVSLYLPFLPLEEEQVRLCIESEMEIQNVSVSDDSVENALKEMEFNSDGFSTSGCKRVADVVARLKYRNYYDEL